MSALETEFAIHNRLLNPHEDVVHHPEIHARVAAVVSAAGSVGGSPLANDAEQADLNMLKHFS